MQQHTQSSRISRASRISKIKRNYYNIPIVKADPVPDMPTIEYEYQTKKILSNSFAPFQIQILEHIYNENLTQLKDLHLQVQNLNFIIPFQEDVIDNKIAPLSLAAALGNPDILKLMLQNQSIEVDIETDNQQLTALKIACNNGYFEIAEILVNHGADVNHSNKDGLTPLYYCFSRLEEEDNYFENKQLCFKLVELLIENGADIDAIINKEEGLTLLMLYCMRKTNMNQRELLLCQDAIRFLLLNGADRDKISKRGKIPFELCQNHPAKEQIQKLLKSIYPTKFTNQIQHKIPSQVIRSVRLEGPLQIEGGCCSLPCRRWWNIF